MPYLSKRTLLFFLSGLVYLRRGVFWCGRRAVRGLLAVVGVFQNTIGFFVYRLLFRIKKRVHFLFPHTGGFSLQFFKRHVLEVGMVLAAAIVMFPQSTFSQATSGVPGRNTLLYRLVGPGDQIFQEDIIIETAEEAITDARGWREGSVSADPAISSNQPFIEPNEISSISAGGNAVTKPSILPGAALPEGSRGAIVSGKRDRVVDHTVAPGETVSAIADAYRIDVQTILWANNLTARSLIRPGDTLKILPTDGVLHTVKKGDTVSKIARLYEAKEAAIVVENKLQKDGSDIVVGEELVVPEGKKPAPIVVPRTNRIAPIFNQVSAPPPSPDLPAGSGYIWPAGSRIITQYFGWRHDGLDIAGKIGTPIYAAQVGTVTRSQCGWNGGYGCYIVVDHGGGLSTLYGHNSVLYVGVGAAVNQGDTIALMGSTGNSTGPHVHFEVRMNLKRTNPLKYVR